MSMYYVQIFSLTDHAKAFDRFQGPYAGLNFDATTSEVKQGKLRIATTTKMPRGDLNRPDFEQAKVILAYRHTDTGELRGTSEMLLPVAKTPWTDLPGMEIQAVGNDRIALKLWNQNFTLELHKHYRIHFMKTIVHLRFFGEVSGVEWIDEKLTEGPSALHALSVDENLTIAPPSGSGFQVKMGQETTTE